MERKAPMGQLQNSSRIASLAPNPGLLRRHHCRAEYRRFVRSSAVQASPCWPDRLVMHIWQ